MPELPLVEMEQEEEETNPLLQPNQFDNDSIKRYKAAALHGVSTYLLSLDDTETLYDQVASLSLQDLQLRYLTVDIAMATYATSTLDGKPLLAAINKIYSTLVPDQYLKKLKFQNLEEVQEEYVNWTTEERVRMSRDEALLNPILTLQKRLLELADEGNTLPYEVVASGASEYRYEPSYMGGKVPLDRGIEIFDTALISEEVPYIRYMDAKGHEFYKCYVTPRLEDQPDSHVVAADINMSPNELHLSIWGESDETAISTSTRARTIPTLKDTPAKHFISCIFKLTTGVMKIKINRTGFKVNDALIMDRLRAALPLLSLGSEGVPSNWTEYDIFGVQFDEISLLELILVDPLFYTFMYVEEKVRPQAWKGRMDVRYRAEFGLNPKINFTNHKLANNRTIKNDEEEDLTLGMGTTYISLFVKTFHPTQSPELIDVLRVLLGYYREVRLSATKSYLKEIKDNKMSDLSELLLIRRGITSGKATTAPYELSKKKQLMALAPQQFTRGYGRSCACKDQPLAISKSEEKDWRNFLVQGNNKRKTQKRQIVKFPKGSNQLSLVCPSDSTPFVGVKPNYSLDPDDPNKYVACCYTLNQVEKTRKNSNYYRYLNDLPPVAKTGGRRSSAVRVIEAGTLGNPPASISQYIRNRKRSLERLGIPLSPASIVHAVLSGISDKKYQKSKNQEKFVVEQRKKIFSEIYPEVCKQELYDSTVEEIAALFEELGSDENKFIDGPLVYRALEEFYDINIFFVQAPIPGDEGNLGELIVPRCRDFHSAPLRLNRESVVLIRISGGETDRLPYPHFDLLVKRWEDGRVGGSFRAQTTKLLHQALDLRKETITWRGDQIGIPNVYSSSDPLQGLNITAQVIDEYGKLRLFQIGNVIVYCDALQPLNCSSLIAEEFVTPSASDVIKLLGDPILEETVMTEENELELLSLTFSRGDILLRVPVYGNIVPELPQDPNPVLVPSGPDLAERYNKIKRDSYIVLSLVTWLFAIARLRIDLTAEEFLDNYTEVVEVNEEEGDPEYNFYNVADVGRDLQHFEDIDEALSFVNENLSNTLVNEDNKFRLPSSEFRDKLLLYLNKYASDTGSTVPTIIQDYFIVASDFIQSPDWVILVSRQEYQDWTSHRLSEVKIIDKIGKGLKPQLISMGEPIFYRSTAGSNVLLIQGVKKGELDRAIAVSANYSNPGIGYNTGFETDPLTEEVEYVTRELDRNNVVSGLDVEAPIQILSYTENRKTKYAGIITLSVEQNEED